MSSEKSREKTEYEKPTMHIIDLAVDEVLGSGCKTTSSNGLGYDPCTSGCNTEGS